VNDKTAADGRQADQRIETGSGSGAVPATAEALVAELHAARARLAEQIGRVIVGQHAVVDEVLVALFAQGHCC